SWGELDIWGVVLSATGIFLVVLGILQLNNTDNWYLVPYLIILGLVLLLTFYLWQKRRIKQDKNPLLDINLLKIKIFFTGGFIRVIGSMGMAGIIFIIPVFIGMVVDGNAFIIGLSLLPLTMSMLIFALLANRLAHYIKIPYLISLGLLMAIIGCLLLNNTFSLETSLWDLVPGTFLIGAGCGLSFILSIDIMMVSAGEKQSDASGLVNTMVMVGWAIGTALIGIILIMGTYSGLATAVEDQFPGKYSKMEIQENLQDWIGKYETTDLKVFKNDKSHVARTVDETIAKAMNTTFDAVAVMFILGFIGSLFLWRGPRETG
ncbi:MAG: MFS transporter, partial [Methanobacterium sp.]|nr:MFS transporter [Methanobacterium sp.]